jgi:histidinol-phosphate/aromatic aminotransferase/cobyric acid decarboxylase-like protein
LAAIDAYLSGLSDFSSRCDTLLLINLDNPSGNCIPAGDITALLEHLKAHSKKLILGESFIDFSGFSDNDTQIEKLSLFYTERSATDKHGC